MIELEGDQYELIENIKEGFDEDVLNERYSEILKKYDFIVGDWGYDQLRLKGFYHNDNMKAPFDSRIDLLDDYLLEYCNFGCAYFILEKIETKKQQKKDSKKDVKDKPKDKIKKELKKEENNKQ